MQSKHTFNIGWYFLFTVSTSIWITSLFMTSVPVSGPGPHTVKLMMLASYGVMYQLPAIILYWLLQRWQRLAIVATVSVSLLCHVLLFADNRLFDLYGFHINGFVWNLLTTPGGFESLGADQTSPWPLLGRFAVLLGLHLLFITRVVRLPFPHIRKRYLVAAFLLLTLGERLAYGISDARLDGEILQLADTLPLYQPLTMHGLLAQLGIKVKKRAAIGIKTNLSGQLDYPKQTLLLDNTVKPVNIIYLVAESLRWDMLTPRIMPNTWALSQQAWRFENHYSTGNGTRQGLFGLFYGLYGVYWDRFLLAEQEPVLFRVLAEKQYDYFLHTSAKFTYPEFDRTIFRTIPADQLQEIGDVIPWQRDRMNIDRLITELSEHQGSRSTYSFMFFESTHARYYFPKDQAIEHDYLQSLDYSTLSRKQLEPKIDGMKARYINAAHYVDIQIGRLLDYLQASGKLDNTIVIITGDHGEEFMEKGRWGHNSAFTEEQVRVPMVIHMPGSEHRVVTKRSSHLDITPTVLTRLGVTNPIEDYSLGYDLSEIRESDTVIVSSWTSIGIINDNGKLVIPLKTGSQHANLATSLDDVPVAADGIINAMAAVLPGVIKGTRSFIGKNPAR